MNEDQIRIVFQKNFNRYMNARRITPKELCEAIGVSKTTISEWKLGRKVPRMDKIDMLCRIFRCNRSDLLEEKPSTLDGSFLDGLTVEELQSVKNYIAFLKSQRNQ